MKDFFETASFHIVKPCNMRCKFCYATFEDMRILSQISLVDAKKILLKLKVSGLQKITFAGGEPMLYKHLSEVIAFSHEIGLITSIITNGSFLTEKFMENHSEVLNWIGISIDSLSEETNKKIGRVAKRMNYWNLIEKLKGYNFKIKINTVVNQYNQHESMQKFIDWAHPDRWKIFDTLRVDGQNDHQFEEIRSTDFEGFISRHVHPAMVVENNEAMTGSYLLIDPQGRLFENSTGKHTYSDPLQNNSMKHCLSQISLDREMFIKRGGIYQW